MVSEAPADASIQSRSRSAIFSLKYDVPASTPASIEKDGEALKNEGPAPGCIPRSASSICLPTASVDTSDRASNNEPIGIRRTLSDDVLSTLGNGQPRRASSTKITEGNSRTTLNKLVRRKSGKFKKDMKLLVSRITIEEQLADPEFLELPKIPDRTYRDDPEYKARSISRSLTSLARKSWLGASRSPSPSKRDVAASLGAGPGSSTAPPPETAPVDHGVTLPKRNSVPLHRKDLKDLKSRQQLNAIFGKSVVVAEVPIAGAYSAAVPVLPQAFSRVKSFSLQHGSEHKAHVPTLPRSMLIEKTATFGLEVPRKKDELWGPFRTLCGEYQKFVSKPCTLKINIVRNTLLPFLRTYADHPSNTMLRPEDLDRRANILNKWWTGILLMLDGRNGQSVSGNDRPAILEGVTGIMIRPEWRLCMPAIYPQSEGSTSSSSTRSTSSIQSDFLSETVFQNIRNMFVQNLLSQMAFVVERMSLPSAPASLVTFCGKATAYALFFCPGIAEILVRLWSVASDSVRRVTKDIDSSFNNGLRDTYAITNRFPQHLRGLSFESLPSMMRHLRRPPQMPMSSAYISWDGPWKNRWAGRESDLFFVFVKQYFVLVCDLLPDDVSKSERARVPCYVLVQAQLLNVLDATIHRASGVSTPNEVVDSVAALTFGDIVGPDVSITSVPLAAPNTSRMMAENRLIMLLREFLAESSNVKELARKSFAESFLELLKAAALRTSIYDHHACFTLCDFLEEAIAILARYYDDIQDPISFLGWDFWHQVLEKMMQSNNSMTEIRLYAFIYSLWNLITKNAERKRNVALDWLLSEDHFHKRFNHWCPMVRAYFMRLLCWRLARYDGEASELDSLILATLSARLNQTWCHLIYMREHAEVSGSPLPSTTPCSPAPGRRLLIVRSDTSTCGGNSLLLFDALLEALNSKERAAYEKLSSIYSSKEASISSEVSNKTWSLLRTINPFANGVRETSQANENSTDSRITGAEVQHSVNGQNMPNAKIGTIGTATKSATKMQSVPFQGLSFKFSLEWSDRPGVAQKRRKLTPPKLPLPAQRFLQTQQQSPDHFHGVKPERAAVGPSKYSGRALAEWSLLILECQNFFERRKYEGVPGLKRVETPNLEVDTFRRLA
ncbi:hypothetical protein MMC13_002494 [Lambiella insularis]|nr:hypothetical protein [Lambiella insularis]